MLIRVQPDGPRTGEILRDWLDTGLNVFGGAIAAAAWARAPLPERAPLGRSGDAWADFWVIHKPTVRPAEGALGEKWEAFRQRLLDSSAVEIRVRTIGADGQPVPGMAVNHCARCRVVNPIADRPVTGQWMQLVAFLPSVWLADEHYRTALTAGWLELARRSDPEYGELGVGHSTAQSWSPACPGGRASPRATFPSLDASCGLWVDHPVPAGNRRAVGRRDAVRARCFCSVVAFEHGGLWLQATPSYDEYDIVAARRLFRALSPVLVAGLPMVLAHGDEARRIVAEHPRPGGDAASTGTGAVPAPSMDHVRARRQGRGRHRHRCHRAPVGVLKDGVVRGAFEP